MTQPSLGNLARPNLKRREREREREKEKREERSRCLEGLAPLILISAGVSGDTGKEATCKWLTTDNCPGLMVSESSGRGAQGL
jgi:hypothetical protein